MTDSKKILVAEDEAHIAKAVVTILKKAFPDFEIEHAKNGEDASVLLMMHNYRLVISDWNMPKKNGDELLKEVRGNEATAALPFILLTARGDRDSVVAALKEGANDYVVKPFKTPEFIAKIKKVLAATDSSSDATKTGESAEAGQEKSPVELIVEKFKKGEVTLPVLPGVVTKVNELFENDEVVVEELAKVIESEAAIAAKLINVANSPLVRGSSKCETVEQAITRLGLKETKNYVFTASNKGMFASNNKQLKEVVEDLWEHSLATAYCSKIMARKLKNKEAEKLFMLGLLHDIGKLLLVGIIDELSKVRAGFDNKDAVHEIMGQLHADFGAALLKNWCYSEEFQNIAHYHHVPFNSKRVSPELLIVYLANLMVRKIGLGKDEEEIENVIDSEAAKKLGVTADMVNEVLSETEENMVAARQAL